MQIGRRQAIARVFGPLDHHHGLAVESVFKACIAPSTRVCEPIKIKMMKIKPREIIRFDQGVGGTCNATLMAQRPQQFANQGGFACAQITAQIETKPWREAGCDLGSKPVRGVHACEHSLGVQGSETAGGVRGGGRHAGFGQGASGEDFAGNVPDPPRMTA